MDEVKPYKNNKGLSVQWSAWHVFSKGLQAAKTRSQTIQSLTWLLFDSLPFSRWDGRTPGFIVVESPLNKRARPVVEKLLRVVHPLLSGGHSECPVNPDLRPWLHGIDQIEKSKSNSIIDKLFPQGLKGDVKQGDMPNCQHVAALYSFKQTPCSRGILKDLVHETFEGDGWIVQFPGFEEYTGTIVLDEDIHHRYHRLLREGEGGDFILLVAFSRWEERLKRKDDRSSDVPHIFIRGTGFMSLSGRRSSSLSFLELYLSSKCAIALTIASKGNQTFNRLNADDYRQVLQLLFHFSQDPEMFVITAGTPCEVGGLYMDEDKRFCTKHMYSLQYSHNKECPLRVVNPHSTREKVNEISEEEFFQYFNFLSGAVVRTNPPVDTQKLHLNGGIDEMVIGATRVSSYGAWILMLFYRFERIMAGYSVPLRHNLMKYVKRNNYVVCNDKEYRILCKYDSTNLEESDFQSQLSEERIALSIVLGLVFLHENHLYHGDITKKNVNISFDGTDFGARLTNCILNNKSGQELE